MSALKARLANHPLWREMTARAVFVAFASSIGAMVYGYDVSWWSSVLGMPSFTEKYGILNKATGTYAISAPLQSAGSAIPSAGLFIGSIICHFISDRWGRRPALFLTAILYIIAIIVEVTADSFWQIVVGRLLNSIPQGISASLLPTYQAECAPASCRGSLISIYTWFLDVGAVTATGIIYRTYDRPDASAYKIVMGIQMMYPVALLVCLPWLPETPRFLCMKNRDDEALAVLKNLRVNPADADQELAQIHESLQVHVEDGSWLDLFRGSNLRRTIITLFIPVVEAWQGLSFVGNYLVVFFIALGTTDVYLLVVLINSTLLITLTFFFWAPDYFGRRKLLLGGSLTMFACFFIMAGVASKDPTSISGTRQQVAIAMLFIWAIVYSSTWANLTWVVLGEMPTTRLKAKTSGLGYGLQSISALVITIFTPYVQSVDYVNWGPYIGFFFGSFSFIAFAFVYFFLPEVKGLSIEQMDLLFEKGATVKEFSKAARGEAVLSGVEPTIRAGSIIQMDEKQVDSVAVKSLDV